MHKCDTCDNAVQGLPYQCRYCGGTFCSSHRLPENHKCPGLDNWGDPGGVFDSGFDDAVVSSTRKDRTAVSGWVRNLTGTGGPLAYFRGNLSYLFLVLIWITFVIQIITLQISPRLHTSLFVLTTDNPLYVWTWILSVFSHGGLGHIVINSIVLYFFGPLVERRVSPLAFLSLFLVAGVAAGLSQIGTAIILGEQSGVVGASGAIMAVMGVLTVLNPNLRVYLFFILPMPLWLLTIGFAAYSVFIAVGAGIGAGQVAHLAHLAGLAIGLVYGDRLRRQGQRLPERLQLGPGGPGGGMGGRRRGPF